MEQLPGISQRGAVKAGVAIATLLGKGGNLVRASASKVRFGLAGRHGGNLPGLIGRLVPVVLPPGPTADSEAPEWAESCGGEAKAGPLIGCQARR